MTPILTIHRAANQIGGNCIEIALGDHRLILDAGSPLELDADATSEQLIPKSLDTIKQVDAIIISHPHQDHYGILSVLPKSWPVWCGAAAEKLMRMTAMLKGERIEQRIENYTAFSKFTVGPFSVTPFLTDHSAFDAYMLLVECAGKRIFYTGDFRRGGRKTKLVDRLMDSPPADVDVLLLEGTTLGRTESFPTEADLEERFISLFKRTPGRVFVTWSAQNIDRTVTIYRACKRSGRRLVLDLYTLDVLERLSTLYDSLPRLGWPKLVGMVSSSMKWLYENPDRMNDRVFVERCAKSGNAIGAAKLQDMNDAVVMLRPSLLKDYSNKGVTFAVDDAWVFSMWSGYLKNTDYMKIRRGFQEAGAAFEHIHTSGHASARELQEFAGRIAPRHLVPIHSFSWDDHLNEFLNVQRLGDGEPFHIR
jgi:ribonuclease J